MELKLNSNAAHMEVTWSRGLVLNGSGELIDRVCQREGEGRSIEYDMYYIYIRILYHIYISFHSLITWHSLITFHSLITCHPLIS